MDIKNIISIAGVSGLYKVLAQTKNGLVVETLVEKKRMPVQNNHQVTKLDDVMIYVNTEDGEVNIKTVFQAIYDKENGGACLSHKSPDAELVAYFKIILPEYDQNKVHLSHIKKVFNWYNLLQPSGLLAVQAEVTEEDKKNLKAPVDTTAMGGKQKLKDTNSKPLKTASSKVKTQGVRKTGVA